MVLPQPSTGGEDILTGYLLSPALTNPSHESFSFPACQGPEHIPDPVLVHLRAVPSSVVMEMMWPELNQTTLGMSDPVYH